MNSLSRGEWTSASNALADRLCHGRHQAQKDLPELPKTDESEAGAVIHALWTGTKPQRKPTAEEIEKAQELKEQESRLVEEFFKSDQGLVRTVERRLWHEFPASTDHPKGNILKTSGQFDVTLVQPKTRRALICDGKSGFLPVTPNPSNLQLRRLAALLWLQIDSREIGVCILKPFERMDPLCVYTLADLERSVLEMEEDVRQSHDSKASRSPGQEQCRYCRVRESCPARLAWLSAALPPGFPSLPLTSAREWTPAQRALFLDREKEARDWLQERKEEIKVLLAETAEAVPGFGLKQGRRLQTITDPLEVMNRFCRVLVGRLESFMKCVKLGKTTLKEEVRALSGHQGKTLEKVLEALLSGCTQSKTSAPIIERLE
jgi:hypothetical protein